MFFFKQKTAYELRISDWGSDLCSSDLNVADDRDATLLEIEQHDREGCCRHGCDWTCLGDEIGRTRLESGLDQERLEALSNPEQECRREDADDQGGEEIGRASSRERVCQYVKVSVVAVSLKKKTKHKTLYT